LDSYNPRIEATPVFSSTAEIQLNKEVYSFTFFTDLFNKAHWKGIIMSISMGNSSSSPYLKFGMHPRMPSPSPSLVASQGMERATGLVDLVQKNQTTSSERLSKHANGPDGIGYDQRYPLFSPENVDSAKRSLLKRDTGSSSTSKQQQGSPRESPSPVATGSVTNPNPSSSQAAPPTPRSSSPFDLASVKIAGSRYFAYPVQIGDKQVSLTGSEKQVLDAFRKNKNIAMQSKDFVPDLPSPSMHIGTLSNKLSSIGAREKIIKTGASKGVKWTYRSSN
jgi:hypothetical protein